MEWLRLSRMLRYAAYCRGEPQGACQRWLVQALRAESRRVRRELANMGLDPDAIARGRVSEVSDDNADTGYGNVSDVTHDPK